MKIKLIRMFLIFFASTNAFSLSIGIDGHSAGDIIAVKTDEQIVEWCDFSKQIVVTSKNVLCVYVGNKQK